MRVGLCISGFVDRFSSKIGFAMVKVLRRLNTEVDFPWKQTRCGQPAFNTGYRGKAR